MTIDMSQFNETYLEEASEHLADLESALLRAEDTGEADVDAIFRAAHSIKGGAGTFGFIEIAEFTHFVEHLLQEVRDGITDLSGECITTLLKAVDVISDMVAAAKEDRDVDDVGQDIVIEELKKISASSKGSQSLGKDTQKNTSSSGRGMNLMDIEFRPHIDMALTGSDPANIITELSEIGTIQTEANLELLPLLSELDPHSLYLSWTIHMETQAGENMVREAFIFVEDESDINITTFASVEGSNASEETPQEQVSPSSTTESPQKDKSESVLEATPMDDRRKNGEDRRKKADRRDNTPKEQTSFIRVSVDKVDGLINLIGELVTSNAMVVQQTRGESTEENQALREALSQMSNHTRQLQEGIMAIRMMPIDFAFSRFPRMIRDTSKKLGKEVNLHSEGGSTELDKTVIEKMTDPLTHLVRNAIDHGLESPEERLNKGKPAEGNITLRAYYKGGSVIIEVEDDGKGLDRDKILAKAIEKGLAQPDTEYSDQEIFLFIFSSGFSTAQQVSDVSGRGVGMDVVSKNIKALGGSIQIDSQKDRGTLFTIGMPLTLAIVDGMAISANNETYIVPLLNIVESIKPEASQIQRMKNNVEVMNVRGEYLPLLRIRQALSVEIDTDAPSDEDSIAIVVESEHTKIALLVDELLGERQVVIKSLEDNYKYIEGISGATILGDGRVALILDLAGLVRLSRREGRYTRPEKDVQQQPMQQVMHEHTSHESPALQLKNNKMETPEDERPCSTGNEHAAIEAGNERTDRTD